MKNLEIVLALITRDNDYQAEQAAAANQAAHRIGAKLNVVYADNDAVNQTQQLVQIIQDPIQRPAAILVEPVGTSMIKVAKAAIRVGIGWGLLNRHDEYIAELRAQEQIPIFSVTTDQEEVGRIQGRQIAAMLSAGNVLYIEGPRSSAAAVLRTRGMLSAKPSEVELKILKGDWTENSAYLATKSWLSLSTSRQLHIRAVVAQNDAMAIGARKALLGSCNQEQGYWSHIPFLGCDGVPTFGQEWVRNGSIASTVITPATASLALDILATAIRTQLMAPQCTLSAPQSYPDLEVLKSKYAARDLSMSRKLDVRKN